MPSAILTNISPQMRSFDRTGLTVCKQKHSSATKPDVLSTLKSAKMNALVFPLEHLTTEKSAFKNISIY